MRAALAAAVAAALAVAPVAQASPTQESTFQDDNRLIYVTPAERAATLDELAGLGVDRLRITVLWRFLAPDADRPERPVFDAEDPLDYPKGTWDRYDELVAGARARGMDVSFNVTGPAPLWANQPPPRPDVADTFEPSPTEFGQFVTAVGRRFPAVRHWSVWNEPNQSGWLTPQWQRDAAGATFERAASLYRELFDAAWSALQATGHSAHTILVGETAPKGDRSRDVKRALEPLTFVRALYCVDTRGRRLAGARAARLGCEGDFGARHPGLLAATGWAHHPYELLLPPSFRTPRRNWVTLSTLSRLTRVLDGAHRAHGSRRRVPLYLTEYGYQTNPPDPRGVSFSRQAAYLNESEWMAWRQRRVRTLSQFLLLDDGEPIGTTFQSGLRTRDGGVKPGYDAYRLPVRVTRRPGRRARVWALLRPAANRAPAEAAIEVQVGTRWRRLRTVRTASSRNYLQVTVRLPRRARALRVAHAAFHSRAVLLRR